MNIAIYSRKSKYTGKGESIGNQIEIAKKYISNNYEEDVSITIYEDEGFSGKNTNRPHFTKMMNDVKRGKINIIICYRLDRISRNIADFSKLITELNDWGIQFVSIKEQFDTSSPMGRAMMYIASVFSQLERETTAERIKDNFKELERTGRWLTGGVPTGFIKKRMEYITNTGKKSSCAILENMPQEMEHVIDIYHTFKYVKSINKVKSILIKKGLKTRYGNYYDDSIIKKILRNPVYCIVDEKSYQYFKTHDCDMCFTLEECDSKKGFIVYNRIDYSKKNCPKLNKSEWIISLGKHQGVIEARDWINVQNTLDSIDHKYGRVKENPVGICNQILKCPKCGGNMGAYRKSENTYYYVCNRKKRFGSSVCDSVNIPGEKFDNLVNQYMYDYMNPSHDIFKKFDKMKKELAINETCNELDLAQKEIISKEKEIDSLLTSLYHADLTSSFIEHVNKKVALLDIELKEMKKAYVVLENTMSNEDKQEILEKTRISLSEYKKNNLKLSVIDKRQILKNIIKKIDYDNSTNEIHIILK